MSGTVGSYGSPLKYLAAAALSSSSSARCPWVSACTWVCTSMATRLSRSSCSVILFMVRLPARSAPRSLPRPAMLARPSFSLGRLRELLADRLLGGGELLRPGVGDRVGRPAGAVGELDGDLGRMRPERQPVAADADGLAGDAGRGVGGEEG